MLKNALKKVSEMHKKLPAIHGLNFILSNHIEIFALVAQDETSKAIFVQLNEKIEFVSKSIHLVFTRLAIISVQLPAVAITLINYYVNDLNKESYIMCFPMT